MTRRQVELICLALGLCCALSCAAPGSLSLAPAGTQASPAYAPPAAGQARSEPSPDVLAPQAPPRADLAPPSPPLLVPAVAGQPGDVKLGPSNPAITETLGQAMQMLAEARAENERLRDATLGLQQSLAEKESALKSLTEQLQQCEARTQGLEQALEKWKQDVLGFRDEMRDYEEAEIQVLQEMVALLKGFKKETAPRTEAAGGNP